MESLRPNKYQCGVRSMTAASTASEKRGSVSVDSIFEQRWNDGYLKTDFLLATFDGRHRRSCIQILAIVGQPGTEWASLPIRIVLIAICASEAITDSELLKLSSSTSTLFGLVLQDLDLMAFVSTLVQCSKNFDSRYDILFREALVNGVKKDLAMCGFLPGAVRSGY